MNAKRKRIAVGSNPQESMDMGNFDIDNLVGDIIGDGDGDDLNFIPSKDSSDEEEVKPNKNVDLYGRAEVELQDIHKTTTQNTNISSQNGHALQEPDDNNRKQESMDINQFNLLIA